MISLSEERRVNSEEFKLPLSIKALNKQESKNYSLLSSKANSNNSLFSSKANSNYSLFTFHSSLNITLPPQPHARQ